MMHTTYDTLTIIIERGEGADVLRDQAIADLITSLQQDYPGATVQTAIGTRLVDYPKLLDPSRGTWNYLHDSYKTIHHDIHARIMAALKAAEPGPEPGQVRTAKQHKRLIDELAHDIVFYTGDRERNALIGYYGTTFGELVTFLGQDAVPVAPGEWPAIIDEALASLQDADFSF